MNKFERIQLVRALGLNTEESVLIASEADWRRHQEFLSQFSRYSVRTFWTDGPEFGAPHYPIIEKTKLDAEYQGLLANRLQLIVAKPIDPSESELAGCLLYLDGAVTAEVAIGPGTVRMVTHEGRIDVRALSREQGDYGPDERLNLATRRARHAIQRLSSEGVNVAGQEFVFEFSWYGYGVGRLKEKLIVWELRAGSASVETAISHLFNLQRESLP